MADMKIGYEEVLARRKGQPPLPTAVVYPCSEDALIGAVEAAKAGLIAPLLVGPKSRSARLPEKQRLTCRRMRLSQLPMPKSPQMLLPILPAAAKRAP